MLTVEQLQARRTLYVQALEDVQKQAAQAQRQVVIQEGAIAAIDDLLKLAQQDALPMPQDVTLDELQNAEFVPA